MKLKIKTISPLLICCLTLSTSIYAATHAHKHDYKNKHPHNYKGERVHNYKGEHLHNYKNEHPFNYKDEGSYDKPHKKERSHNPQEQWQYSNIPMITRPSNHFEIIGAVGAAKLQGGNSDLGITSSEIDRLVQTSSNNWNTFGAQVGICYVNYFPHAAQNSDNVQLLPSIEPQLNIYYLGNATFKGDVWRFKSPAFNELTYEIPVRSTRLMLDAALTLASYKKLSVYVKGGVGQAWNRISYTDKDKDPTTFPDERLNLNAKTNSNFVWEAGAGMKLAFNDRIGMSLEYLYADLGKVKTSANGNTGNITAPVLVPAQFNLKSQSALLGLHVAL